MDEETKNKIKELEEELENKEIMINALLNEIKIMKNKRKNDKENEIKRIKRENNNVYKSFDNKNGWDMMSMDNNSWNTQPLETVTSPNTLETVNRSNTLQPLENIYRPNTAQPLENIYRPNTTQPLESINRPNTLQPLENTNRSNTPPIVSQVKTSPIISQSNRSNTPPIVSQVKTSPLISQVKTSPIKKKSKPLSVRDKKKIENSLKEQLDSLINYKRVNKGLGNHCFFEEFVEFCVDTLPFTFGPSHLEIKQNVKNFMIQNNSRISGFICKNINSYSLLQIYSPLNCLSTILSPLESCVVFHDILLMIDDYTRLHFVFHSLFMNKIDNGVLGSTILNLISYQLKVDLDLYKSKKSIIQNLSSLKCNYELPKSTKSLEDFLLDLTKPIPVFNKKMINENIYEYVFSIRMLTHYLDWDYTFNTYFNEILYPKLEEDDSYLLYLGICNFNFYRIFGEIESTGMVNDLIKSKMEKVSTTSILSYLLIKQIDPLIASNWLEENTKELISQGWSIEYLMKYLLF